jgi:hypothetical protein
LPCADKQKAERGSCKCPEKQIFVETTQPDGTLQISCRACPSGEYAGPGWECKKCPHFAMSYGEPDSAGQYACTCKAGYAPRGDGCVNEVDLAAAKRLNPLTPDITYRSLQFADGSPDARKPASVSSAVFSHYLAEAAVGCWKDGVPRFCQVLANLCVLTLYDQGSPACGFLREQMGEGTPGSAKWANKLKDRLPWIVYPAQTSAGAGGTGDGDGKAALLTETLASQGYEVVPTMLDDKSKGLSRYMKFQLGQYALNGTWLGFTELGSQISICPLSYRDVLNLKRFGM